MAEREPEERADNVSISIAKKLANFYHPSSECCIFRMYDNLRRQNEKAYEPSIVAIGPYHRGKAKLQQMEEHKLWYLQQLLNREKKKSVNDYIMAIKELEERARNCYAETIRIKSDEFVEMMLLDSFFIIGLFRKFKEVELADENDHIFQSQQIQDALRRDLILLENQLPFFILVRLFNMTKTDLDLQIIQIALTFLQFNAPDQKLEAPRGISINNIKHLLHLVHSCWCFKFSEMNRNATEKQLEFINSATELQESGIQFKKAEERNLFDIKFISGILEIPFLSIEAEVGESFFTNLVAFEVCPSYHSPKYVCDYAVFMNCLINSSEDVRLLRHSGIIESWVGDDAELYSMWHKLFNVTLTDTKKFSYSQVFNDVNNHCKRRRNMWMANLKRNYFNSPWALISILAATILLLLTMAQTIFSILSFGKGSFN
ncbi:UPF0481 protein At3g47200-like [Camellia sinensis]|uniref:UPF0481 protein At3g47200-like n=1 Tax=Camellia sinensis TaxID=4442 RepID=UPI0010369B28|nr:UPF0481 protein At3g47200-like [Camellia sinensis]